MAVAAIGLALVLWLTWDPLQRLLLTLLEAIRAAGPAGAALYVLVYVLASILLLPGSLLTAGAGFAYGLLGGALLVSLASTLAATAAFLLGRTAARGWVQRRIGASPRLAALDEAMGSGGFKIVLLLRLSPVLPFNLLNYALGLTRVGLGAYVLASWIGMVPGTILFVYAGTLVTSLAQLGGDGRPETGAWGTALLALGLFATLLVTLLLTRMSRRALEGAVRRGGPPVGGIAP